MSDTSFLVQLLMANTIGDSIILENMRAAISYYKALKNGNHRRLGETYRSSYAFIQGSGLDLLIEDYQLNLDPVQLRNSFNYCLHHLI